MILDKSLASFGDISKAWSWVTSTEGYNIMLKPNSINKALSDNARLERYNETIKSLMRFGGFTPPSTASMSEQEEWDNWLSLETPPSTSHNKQLKQRHRRMQSKMPSAVGPRPSSHMISSSLFLIGFLSLSNSPTCTYTTPSLSMNR